MEYVFRCGVQTWTAIALLICERYGMDVTPVVALLAVGRPAVAEEARGIAISAMAEILHARDVGAREPRGDVARKVEERVLRPRRGLEETRVRAVLGREAGDEFRPDLVVRLANHRPERSHHAGAIGSAPPHRRNRAFENPGRGAAPAGMGGADDPGLLVGEQHGAA